MRHLLLAFALLCSTAAAAFAQRDPFAYDVKAPLELVIAPAQRSGDTVTSDVSFDGLAAGTVHGVLVEPAGPKRKSRAPGILWVHWLGDPATSNHSEFLPEAKELAARGAISLLVDAMWSDPDWYEKRNPAGDERQLVAQVIALRRALDVLVSYPGVDAARIAYVGHDFGAMYGALAAAADPRIHAAVFMTPSPTFWEWLLFGPAPSDVPAYVAAMSAYDLPRRLPAATFSASLWQFAKNDPYVATATASQAKAWIPNRGRTIVLYDAGHGLALQKARDDRIAWLKAILNL